MRRSGTPAVSEAGQAALETYAQHLQHQRDLRMATQRNYSSDLRQFAAWWEATGQEADDAAAVFLPALVITHNYVPPLGKG